jgi:hypothetical protein
VWSGFLEDPQVGGTFTPLSDFTNVTFQNCKTLTTTGAEFNLTGATLTDIVMQLGKMLVSPIEISATELEVSKAES